MWGRFFFVAFQGCYFVLRLPYKEVLLPHNTEAKYLGFPPKLALIFDLILQL